MNEKQIIKYVHPVVTTAFWETLNFKNLMSKKYLRVRLASQRNWERRDCKGQLIAKPEAVKREEILVGQTFFHFTSVSRPPNSEISRKLKDLSVEKGSRHQIYHKFCSTCGIARPKHAGSGV